MTPEKASLLQGYWPDTTVIKSTGNAFAWKSQPSTAKAFSTQQSDAAKKNSKNGVGFHGNKLSGLSKGGK